MQKNKVVIIILIAAVLSSCNFIRKYQLGDAIVKVGDAALYERDIERITRGTTGADSARIAEQYIRQWATEAITYQTARSKTTNKADIEALVENYRHSLYVHEYEKQLIQQRMPKDVSDDSISVYYQSHPEQFMLRQALIKGVFIVVGNDVPEQQNLESWLKDLTDENLEFIEKYAYQYAVGYEFFKNEWKQENQLLLRMPLEQNTLSQRLRTENLITITDSTHTYRLRVTDKRLVGEQMPEDFAKAGIEHIILEQRQADFLNKQKAELFESGIRRNKIVIKQNTSHQDISNNTQNDSTNTITNTDDYETTD